MLPVKHFKLYLGQKFLELQQKSLRGMVLRCKSLGGSCATQVCAPEPAVCLDGMAQGSSGEHSYAVSALRAFVSGTLCWELTA